MNSKKMRAANRKRINNTLDEREAINGQREKVSQELNRVSATLSQSESILDEIDSEFEKQTHLQKKDVVLLFTAVALQVIRQYLFTKGNFFDRVNDKKAAAEAHKKGTESNSLVDKWYKKYEDEYEDKKLKNQRGKGYYEVSIDEIVNRPVPFDTSKNAGYEKLGIHVIGGKLGLGGGDHRYVTLGHDPILGLVFGTANIATRTATLSNLSSFHIRYGIPNNLNAKGKSFKRNIDYFWRKASTVKVLKYGIVDPIQSKDPEKLSILCCALLKEIIHLKSDVKSVKGLAIPFTTLKPEMAKELAEYKIDTDDVVTVSKQAVLTLAINKLVLMIHRAMFVSQYDGTLEIYKVRTKKILMLSNLISSTSNVIVVAVEAKIKGLEALNSLDVGGIMVTIASLFHEAKFISRVKEEFLRSNWEQRIMGNELVID